VLFTIEYCMFHSVHLETLVNSIYICYDSIKQMNRGDTMIK